MCQTQPDTPAQLEAGFSAGVGGSGVGSSIAYMGEPLPLSRSPSAESVVGNPGHDSVPSAFPASWPLTIVE